MRHRLFQRQHQRIRTGPRTSRAALAGAAAGALLALVLGAPAAWLADATRAASGGRIWLDDARGSVWRGSARLVLTGGEGSRDAMALPGEVRWQLWPAWLGLGGRIEASCCTRAPARLAARLTWGGAEFSVSELRSDWPAAVLAGLGTPWNTLQLDGQLQLDSERLVARQVQGRVVLEGSARLDAHQIGTRLSTLRPIGSYRLALDGGGSAAPTALRLDTLDGSLRLSGRGELTSQGLRFRGEASADQGREAALANLLNIIGRRQGARSVITIG